MDAMLFFTFLLIVVPVSASGWQYEIYVNNTSGNIDSCWQGREYKLCPSLNLALQAVKSSTVIYLYPGNYTLMYGIETEINNISNVAIIGLGNSNEVIIDCLENAGLSFYFSNKVVLKSLKLEGCGAIRNSTSANYNSNTFEYFKYKVAIYVLFCKDLIFSDLKLYSSNGTSLSIYNTVGTVSIVNTSVLHNVPNVYGGGGLQIQFTYCIPGNLSCFTSKESQIIPYYSSHSTYNISNCTFHKNAAKRGYANFRKITNDGIYSYSFGRGGGLSIILKGSATNNTINVKECSILENEAHFGGGFYVSFHDTTSNNMVRIEDSKILGNQNYDVHKQSGSEYWDTDGGGGGGKAVFTVGSDGISPNNFIHVRGCTFSHNTAIAGGGLWVEIALSNPSDNKVILENSNFTQNSAFLGSGAYISGVYKRESISVYLTNVTFKSNTPICSDEQLYAYLPCSGILYSTSHPIIINGTMTFINNAASAIELHDTKLDIRSGSHLEFTGNKSPYGGALALYDCSFITVYSNTSLTFINNTADVLGGAIYAGSCTGANRPAIISVQCFIQYFDPTIHPDNWDTMFTFINNTAENDTINALYAVSVSPCWWPEEKSTFVYNKDINQTFCWKTWNYSRSHCIDNFQSAPAFLKYDGFHDIYPGQEITLPIVYDGVRRNILHAKLIVCAFGPASFGSQQCVESDISNTGGLNLYHNHNYNESNPISNERIHVTVETDGGGTGGTFQPSFDLHFLNCKWPFSGFDGSQCFYKLNSFDCFGSDNNKCGVGFSVKPKAEYCITNTSDLGLVVGHCPLAYNARPKYKPMLQGSPQSCRSHHSGMLCGECEPSYGIPINSVYFECVDCRKSNFPGSLLFLIFEILPLTFMVIFIILFDVKLTTGIMSGFVFYSQIVTLNFPVWYYPAWFTFNAVSELIDPLAHVHFNRLATTLYSVWNLNFLIPIPPSLFPICISNHMEPLGVIAFWYIVPIYPLILIFTITGWTLLYTRGIKVVVFITRPVHQRLARFWRILDIELSLVDSIAGIYVLCFTQLVTNSFKFLHYATWQSLQDEKRSGKAFFFNGNIEYFGWPHAMYGAFAIIILLLFVLMPTIFLLLFPFKFFHRFLDFIKMRKQILIAFGDVFTGTFRDGSDGSIDFRCFAGLYLLLRIFILCFYYIPSQHSEVILYLETATCVVFGGILMIFRPFKRNLTNFANFLIFFLLGLMSALCLSVEEKGVLVNITFLMHIPMIVAICYFMYWIRKKVISVFRYSFRSNLIQDETTEEKNDDENLIIDNDTLPDRLVNPEEYTPTSSTYSTMNTLPNDATIPLRRATSYGSFTRSSYGSTRNS